MADNDQQLPSGLGVAPAVAPQVPGAPAGSSVINMPNPTATQQYQQQFLQPAPQVPAGQEPPAQVFHQNPMLTTLTPPGQAPAPQPAPAPAPVVPPVVPEAPKVEAAPGSVTDLAGALGTDPMIAPAIAFLEAATLEAGLDATRAFGNAADELDPRFIDRAYLIEKVGQAKADQMIKVAESTIVFAKQARENLYNECRAVAGDNAKWDQAVALFNQHADPATKEAISAMFDSMNKAQMVYAAKQLVEFANRTGGVVNATIQPLGAPGTAQGLSSDAYRQAIAALPRNAPDSAYEALRQQRAVGQKAGL